MLKGIPVAKGIAIGPCLVLKKEELKIPERQITEQEIDGELQTFEQAIAKSIEQINKIQSAAVKELGAENAQLFEAHKLLLADPALKDSVASKLKCELVGVEKATFHAVEELKQIFEMMDDAYMRERVADIKDVGERLVRNLTGQSLVDLSNLDRDVIIIAEDLTPSDTAAMDKEHVKGFATEIGGETSHTAIIARTLELPAVVGCGKELRTLKNGDVVVLDGSQGVVLVNPDKGTLADYQQKAEEFRVRREKLRELRELPAITMDGHRVELAGNIAKPDGVERVLENGGEAVGLFRTEFLYMSRNEFPNEEVQFKAYKEVADKMGERPVIIRTLDIGGDKHLSYLDLSGELNPFLGYRAIRICLDQVEIFKTQLRALLRASVYGNIKVMFPMISGLQELRQCKAILAEVKEELRKENIAFNDDMQVGIMIEIPSAAMIADQLIKDCDFFSIGTNDLCQYTLAVDRMNEKVSYLYDPLHPGVLRLIKQVIEAGHTQAKMVGVCGEMAADVVNAVILLGLGLDEFSMSASAIPYVKEVFRKISLTKAQQIVEKVMEMDDSKEIKRYVEEEIACL